MKKMKNNLDERQEEVLLKIEHNGCWLAFWGLLAVIIIEPFVFGQDIRVVTGEWIVFMLLAIYMMIACLKNGIWDRRFKPTLKTNLAFSTVAALIVGIMMFIQVFRNYPDKIVGSVTAGCFSAMITFVMCLIFLTIGASIYKKKHTKDEAEEEEFIR